MVKTERRYLLRAGLGFLAVATALLAGARTLQPAEALPARILDATFWQLVSEFSEAGGAFRFQFMSNEREFPAAVTELKKVARPGAVYLGVGPEQNFSYIAGLQPAMAFIFDIRRQNMLEHLIYKAVFEMSSNRTEFVARLFSRKAPPARSDKSSAAALFEAFDDTARDSRLFSQNLQAVRSVLVNDHHFPLTSEDLADIDAIYQTFFDAGLGVNDSGRYWGRGLSYARLMAAVDDQGKERSYLASEENFRFVRDMQRKNLIVPLVGDFAGTKAIRAVAAYLKERQAVVGTFYTSNVEQYLFRQGDEWRRFYANVALLPTDAFSTLVRSSHLAFEPGGERLRQYNSTNYFMLLCPIRTLVKTDQAGGIRGYEDALRISK